MFCTNCGREIDNKAIVCIHCGVPTNLYADKSEKSMVIAILLCIFFGAWGVHRFYLEQNNTAIAQLVLTVIGWATVWLFIGIFPLAITGIWAFLDLILIATGSLTTPDGKGLS